MYAGISQYVDIYSSEVTLINRPELAEKLFDFLRAVVR